MADPSATPLWIPLAIAALGLIGTATSPLITQLLVQRGEKRRRDSDREDLLIKWRREDQLQWTTERRDAYLTAISVYEALRRELFDFAYHSIEKFDSDKFLGSMSDATDAVSIWGSDEASEAVANLHRTTMGLDDADDELEGLGLHLAAYRRHQVDTAEADSIFTQVHSDFRTAQNAFLNTVRADLRGGSII